MCEPVQNINPFIDEIMKTKDIKTIDVITKKWFDKVNGNSYFAQKIIINKHRNNEVVIYNPFQYGYSSFDHFAKQCVMQHLNLKTDIINNWDLCSTTGKIKFDNVVISGCKKRELTHINEL